MSVDVTNARKIVVGADWRNYKAYQLGSTYRQPQGNCLLVNFLQNEKDESMVDLYLKPNKGARFKWKSIRKDTFLEVEYDSNPGE